MNSLRVVSILEGTTVDGPGFRTSIYFAGCDHHCPSCHNPSTWDHEAGSDMSIAEIMERINDADCNVTFSGGDPMLQAEALLPLAEAIRRQGKTIWCYTGYTYEQVLHDKSMSRLLPYLEVLVDGPFIESLRDTSLLFRGSSNQRLIDIDRSKEGEISLWVSAF